MSETFRLGTRQIAVVIASRRGGLHLGIDGAVLACVEETGGNPSGPFSLTIAGRPYSGWRHVEGASIHLRLNGRSFRLVRDSALHEDAASEAGENDITAPMPGVVIALACAEGQAVAKGETLLRIESMKLQTTISAPRDGTIAQVQVAHGQTFEKDAVLVTLHPAGS